MSLPPHLQSAWDKGTRAGEEGASRATNPFRPEGEAELCDTWEAARAEADCRYTVKPPNLGHSISTGTARG